MATRKEADPLGERQIPKDAYYGIQTYRATENFPVLVTSLGIHEKDNETVYLSGGTQMTSQALKIDGSITNEGKSTAYNVELNVTASDVYGKILINIVVPLDGGFVNGETPTLIAQSDNPTSIDPMQSTNVDVTILCQGTPVVWNIIPLHTNSP